MLLKTILSRRGLLKLSTTVTGIAGFLGLDRLAYAQNAGTAWLDITQLNLKLPHLDANFHGFRLVQISDIHMDGWMNRRRLEEIIRLVNAQQPDLVVIPGGFVCNPRLL